MPILSGDIKLNSSQVMLDVPEGGGGPTANVIPDGVSNAVFPDISELDRVNGRVNLRQLHVTVQTDNTDTYLGANVIVADPPEDPNVSITLFSTGNAFDTRAEAVSRMEAYLNIGGAYQGYLFGNHIAGQSTLLILQRSDTVVAIGETLVLTKREGYPDEFQQYVRVTEASLVAQTFTDAQGDYTRNLMTVQLSDVLRQDFLGFDATRYEIAADPMRLRTKISNSVVANAARYYGVVALQEDASIGDFTVKAESMFTQLVPSAQVETPLSDVRSNQISLQTAPAGSPFTQALNLSGPTLPLPHTLFIGAPVTRGSFDIYNSSLGHVFDDAGVLKDEAGVSVGVIDYESGAAVFSSWLRNFSYTLTYTPAAVFSTVSQSQGFEVTQANRALNYVRTIEPPPVQGSLTVSFRAQDKWYVLRDDGTGALRGSDTSVGAGTVNFTTGTVMVTFGAMPDVDTMVIYQWVQPNSERDAREIILGGGNFKWLVNADGLEGDAAAGVGIAPNGLAITWLDGATTRTVNDNGAGLLTGYGTGRVNYAEGIIEMSPTTLPPPGTQITITRNSRARLTATPSVNTIGTELHFSLGASVNPGSVYFQLPGQRRFRYGGGPLTDFGDSQSYALFDRGAGRILMFISAAKDFAWVLDVGTIDYPTGNVVLDIQTALTSGQAERVTMFDNMYLMTSPPAIGLRSA